MCRKFGSLLFCKALVISEYAEDISSIREVARHDLEDAYPLRGVAADDQDQLWISTSREKLRWDPVSGFKSWIKNGGAFFRKKIGRAALPMTNAIISYRGTKNGWLREGVFKGNLDGWIIDAKEDHFGHVWFYGAGERVDLWVQPYGGSLRRVTIQARCRESESPSRFGSRAGHPRPTGRSARGVHQIGSWSSLVSPLS